MYNDLKIIEFLPVKMFSLHLGIGICGEPCPPKCRVCHLQVVNEIFFGNEDEPDARFVHLPDCKHLSMYFSYLLFIERKQIKIQFSRSYRIR